MLLFNGTLSDPCVCVCVCVCVCERLICTLVVVQQQRFEGGQVARNDGGAERRCQPSRGCLPAALCADRDKRPLLSRSLIGLFTSCELGVGGGLRKHTCEGERERQPLTRSIMTLIRPGLLPHCVL